MPVWCAGGADGRGLEGALLSGHDMPGPSWGGPGATIPAGVLAHTFSGPFRRRPRPVPGAVPTLVRSWVPGTGLTVRTDLRLARRTPDRVVAQGLVWPELAVAGGEAAR